MANPHYGGFWIRFLAAVLDALIIGIPVGILIFGLLFATKMNIFMYIVQLAAIVFTIYMDGIKGGTPGKLILGLRIVNEKGEYIGIPTAILRYIGKMLSAIILGIGYLMVAFTQKKQGLHDKIAKTFVIYLR
ncbi:MAG: RDD family protein [Nanoarchaeota archaeon]